MAARALARLPDGLDHSRTWVMTTAVALLVTQLVLRAWAAWSSWYFLDDLVFLRRYAEASDWSYLVEPYNGHLMPVAKSAYWLIRATGPTEWWPAALILVVRTGSRERSLPLDVGQPLRRPSGDPGPLLPLPLPPALRPVLHVVHRRPPAAAPPDHAHHRRGRLGALPPHPPVDVAHWCAAAALCLGLAFWPKALFLLPLLAYLSVAYFSAGGLMQRLRGLRWQLLAFAPLLVVGVAYVGYYVSVVPEQLTPVTARLMGEFAGTMLGTTLVSGLVGGPWQWNDSAPPNAFADPPSWAVHLSWVVVVAVVAYAWLRRIRTGRALLLFLGYVGGTFVLVLTSRAGALGATLGTDSRYLSDIPLVAALCLGLAFIDLPGAPGSSALRLEPRIHAAPRLVGAVLLVVVLMGSLASSFTYVRPWHRDNAAHPFFDRFRTEVEARGRTDLVDRVVPEDVMSQLAAPANNFEFLAPLVTDAAHFPEVSSDLAIVGDDGSLRQVAIEPRGRLRPGARRAGADGG